MIRCRSTVDKFLGYLEISEVGLFIEGSRLETERVDDVIDLGRALLKSFILILGRWVGTYLKVSYRAMAKVNIGH